MAKNVRLVLERLEPLSGSGSQMVDLLDEVTPPRLAERLKPTGSQECGELTGID